MMIFIAHRGNTDGRFAEGENKPWYIDKALEKGYDVEIDVWCQGDALYLGHDAPEVMIDAEFLRKRSDRLWCHAKNTAALGWLLANGFHCFFHDVDDYTLTSKGFVWAYPGKELISKCIAVMPERAQYSAKELSGCMAICTDDIAYFTSFVSPDIL